MKKSITFLILTSTIYSKKFLLMPYNIRTEAMGSTGMIFGREYGSFYYSPTAFSRNKKISSSFNLYFKNYGSGIVETKKGNVGKYNLGKAIFIVPEEIKMYENKEFVFSFTSLPFSYFYNINDNISIGLGTKLVLGFITEQKVKTCPLITLPWDIGILYKNTYGSFSFSVNNIFFLNLENYIGKYRFFKYLLKDDLENKKDIELAKNLRIGYGKEIKTKYWNEKIKFAFEIDNLLCQKIYFVDKSGFNFLKKVHIGVESSYFFVNSSALLKHFNRKYNIRLGINNLWPTFGIGFKVWKLKINYAFYNKSFGKGLWNDIKFHNSFSINLIF